VVGCVIGVLVCLIVLDGCVLGWYGVVVGLL